jgi:hypothetical protein
VDRPVPKVVFDSDSLEVVEEIAEEEVLVLAEFVTGLDLPPMTEGRAKMTAEADRVTITKTMTAIKILESAWLILRTRDDLVDEVSIS